MEDDTDGANEVDHIDGDIRNKQRDESKMGHKQSERQKLL